jgi:hypothetical protein
MQPNNMPSAQFHLHRVRPIVESYRLPEVTDWSADAAYQMTFDFLSLTIQPRPAGYMRLNRTPGEDRFQCGVEVIRRGVDDANFHLVGEYDCRQDQLATPMRWDFRSWVDHGDPVAKIAYTGLRSQARMENGKLRIQTGRVAIRHAINASDGLAAKWMLLEAVQRWPVDAPPVSFSIVDENDALWENQTMAWIGEPIVMGNMTLRGLLHLGKGTLPRSFWMNQDGLLLFVISGTEIAVLANVNGVEASYDRRYTISELSAEPF